MKKELLFIDFETYYDSKEGYDLRKMSLTNYINDPRFKVHGMAFSYLDGEPKWLNHVSHLSFDWSNIIVVSHNVKFDGAILKWRYGIQPAGWLDTAAIARAYFGASQGKFSLKAVSERLGLPPKLELTTDGKKDIPEELGALVTYCKRDTELCRDIFKRCPLSEKVYQEIDLVSRAFIEPQLVLDQEMLKQIVLDIQAAKEEALRGFDPTILRSSDKFSALLVGLGATIPTKKSPTDPTKTVPAFDRRDPGFIALLNHPQEQIRKAATARLVAKQTMEGKRAENLANLLLAPVGGCFPFDVVFSGASQTHRLSGGDGAEGNPQNFPTKSEIRSAIQAPKGFKIICADFEKIDTRILAFISGDPALKKEVLDKNIYCLFAARLFNRLIDKHADPDEYKLGKCSILGLGYQMGWKRHKDDVLAKANITISDEESKRDVKTYRATYKHVPGLWDLCEAIFPALQRNAEISFPGARFLKIQKEKIILPSGLAICLPGIKQVGEKWEYQAYSQGEWRSQGIYGGALTAMICQALTGEVCKEAMRRCADMGYRFAGQVHDELLFVVPEEEAYLAEGLIKTAMEAPMSWWPDLPLKVEIHTADNWREAK